MQMTSKISWNDLENIISGGRNNLVDSLLSKNKNLALANKNYGKENTKVFWSWSCPLVLTHTTSSN